MTLPAKRIIPPRSLRGTIALPGDKSISHRAAILNAIAAGAATTENFLPADDCLSTLACLRALGVDCALRETTLTVQGTGLDGLRESADVLDAGNSGTTMRLLAGLLAGRPFRSVLAGDESLRSRPMGRIIAPLKAMGAQIEGRAGDTLAPLTIRGGRLMGITHRSPVASAQVKSALLLAGLQAEGDTTVEEPALSRDHTERMLRAMGARIEQGEGRTRVSPLTKDLTPLSMRVPGDFSAAAFWLVAAALHPDAQLHLQGVGVNPTRTGLIDVLRQMGAQIEVANERTLGGEPVADITVRSSRLAGTTVEGETVVTLIDEVPALAVAAALAAGRTVIRDAAELRVKESDRIAATAQELRRLGAKIEERPDGMTIDGVASLRGAPCDSHGDHRLALALAVAGMVAKGDTLLSGAEAVSVSYPRFWEHLAEIGSE